MTDRLTLAVVTAGLSEDSTTTRLGEAIAQAASTTVENAGQHVHIKVIQLRDLAHGLTDMMITHVASRAVQDAIDTVLSSGRMAVSSTSECRGDPPVAATTVGRFSSADSSITSKNCLNSPE